MKLFGEKWRKLVGISDILKRFVIYTVYFIIVVKGV